MYIKEFEKSLGRRGMPISNRPIRHLKFHSHYEESFLLELSLTKRQCHSIILTSVFHEKHVYF